MKIAALALILVACTAPVEGPPVCLTPTVIVDAAFSAEEIEGITAGLALWHDADASIAFTTITMPRDEAIAEMADTSRADRVYLYRVAATTDTACPTGAIGAGHFATTKRTAPEEGIAVICLDAPFAVVVHALPQTIAHEIGHSFGLQHDDSGDATIMASTLEHASSTVTARDVATLRAL